MRNEKIKIMQITHDLAIGGLQQVIVNICKNINREKFDMSVLCLRNLGEYVPEIKKQGMEVIYIPQKKGTDYFSFLKVAKILRNEKIDVIHTHNTQPLVDGTLAALLTRVRTIVHTDHARLFPDKRRYMFLEWLMSQFCYKIVGVSDHTSKNLMRYVKISRRKILTIPNGIDEKQFSIQIDKRKKLSDLKIDKKGPFIGIGVRLTEQKGISYLIQSLPEVLKRFPDLALIIAGDGPLRENLENEAKKLGISPNVFFIGPQQKINEFLNLLDLYVLPSIWEGLPLVILEAFAAKCPVIATDVGGVSTVIQNGQNGSLVEAKDPAQLTKEITRLLSNEKLRNTYKKNAFNTLIENYSANIMTQKYEKLYLRQNDFK